MGRGDSIAVAWEGGLSPDMPWFEDRFQDLQRKHKSELVERHSGGGRAEPRKIKVLLCDYSDPYEKRAEEDFNE